MTVAVMGPRYKEFRYEGINLYFVCIYIKKRKAQKIT